MEKRQKMDTMTPKQKRIYDAISRLSSDLGRPVRRVEIERHLGINRAASSLLSMVAAGHITRYDRQGYLTSDTRMVLQ